MDGVFEVLSSFPTPQTPPSALELETAKHITALTNLRKEWRVSYDDGELLKALNPSLNSVSYLYAILAFIDRTGISPQFAAPTLDDNGTPRISLLWQNVLDFAVKFDPEQLQYARDGILELFEKIKQSANVVKKPLLAIPPIKAITQRLGSKTRYAYSIQASFLSTCLELRRFRAALAVLGKDLNVSLKGEDFESLLEYHSNAGLVFAGLKLWPRALEHFALVLSAATRNVIHSLMVEALKKWTLISLIHNGKPLPIPKTVNSTSKRLLYALALQYNEVAESFTEGNAQKLKSLLIQHHEIWKKDGNFGLVLQAYTAFNRFNLLKLQKVYQTYPLDKVNWESVESSFGGFFSETLSAESQEKKIETGILDIVEHTTFSGTIEHGQGTGGGFLVFSGGSKHSSSATSEVAMVGRLEAQTKKITDITASITEIDRRFALRREYLIWAKKAVKDGPMTILSGPGSGEPMDLGWDEFEIEGENSPVE